MRILVIRFSSLGDVILATAPLQALAMGFRDSEVTFVTKDRYAALFDAPGLPYKIATLADDEPIAALAQRFGRGELDWIIDLHGSLRSRLLCARLKAKHTSRMHKSTVRRWRMVWGKHGLGRPLSVLQSYTHAASAVGELTPTLPRLTLTEAELARVSGFRSTATPIFGIGWGARHPTKAVPAELWSNLFPLLGANAHYVLFAEGSEESTAGEFIARQKQSGGFIDTAIDLPLRELMVRLAGCALFLSSDSGLMHMAAALDVPTIGLFGPTHPALGFAPAGERSHAFHAGTWCSPCHRHGSAPCFRERRFCFDELDIDAIAQTVRRYLL